METVSIKLEASFLKEVEHSMKEHHYATKTEFIREAMRDKLTELEKKHALEQLDKVHGAGKGKHKSPTKKEMQRAKEAAFEEVERYFREHPQEKFL